MYLYLCMPYSEYTVTQFLNCVFATVVPYYNISIRIFTEKLLSFRTPPIVYIMIWNCQQNKFTSLIRIHLIERGQDNRAGYLYSCTVSEGIQTNTHEAIAPRKITLPPGKSSHMKITPNEKMFKSKFKSKILVIL